MIRSNETAKLSLYINTEGRVRAEKEQRGKIVWGWKSFWKLACWWHSMWNSFCVCILDLIPDLVYFPVSGWVPAYCCCCCHYHDLLLLWGECCTSTECCTSSECCSSTRHVHEPLNRMIPLCSFVNTFSIIFKSTLRKKMNYNFQWQHIYVWNPPAGFYYIASSVQCTEERAQHFKVRLWKDIPRG